MTNLKIIENYKENVEWMVKPNIKSEIKGLEHLSQIDSALIKRLVNWLEVFDKDDVDKKFIVKNMLGQIIYYGKEESNCCMKCCCGRKRSFKFIICDKFDNVVMIIKHPYQNNFCRISCRGSKCCRNNLIVTTYSGQMIGYIQESNEYETTGYFLLNEKRENELFIKEPLCINCYCCRKDGKFKIMDKNGRLVIGEISRKWENWTQEFMSNTDNYGAKFPIDLSIRMKALILAATFFIDFLYFENT